MPDYGSLDEFSKSLTSKDLESFAGHYYQIKMSDGHIEIKKPWYSWIVTFLFGWETQLDPQFTHQLFQYITSEIRKIDQVQQPKFDAIPIAPMTTKGRSKVISPEETQRLIALTHLFKYFAPQKDETSFLAQAQSPEDKPKDYIINEDDLIILQLHLLSSLSLTPESVGIAYNRIVDLSKHAITEGKQNPGPENAKKAYDLIVMICQFEENASQTEQGYLAKAGGKFYTITFDDVEKLKSTILNTLADGPIPSLEWIQTSIRFDDNLISPEEVAVFDFCKKKFPNRNKALIHFEMLNKKMNKAIDDLSKYEEQDVVINGQAFPCYKLKEEGEEQFLIHAAAFDAIQKFEDIADQRKSGGLCTSLFKYDSEFFNQGSSVAFVLNVPPERIVSTNAHDIQSPGISLDGLLLKDPGAGYYNLYHKLSLITSYVDTVYGLCNEASGDMGIVDDAISKYTRLKMLRAGLMDQLQPVIKKEVEKQLKDCNENSDPLKNSLIAAAPLVKNIIGITDEILELKKKYPTAPGKTDYFDKFYDRDFGHPYFQLQVLIDYYENNPDKNTPEEFRRVFGREGNDMINELNKFVIFFDNLKKQDRFLEYRFYFNRMMSPGEIFRQTAPNSEQGIFPWNEINVDMRNIPGLPKEQVEVKALLIDYNALNQALNTPTDRIKVVAMFTEAQSRGLPIFIR